MRKFPPLRLRDFALPQAKEGRKFFGGRRSCPPADKESKKNAKARVHPPLVLPKAQREIGDGKFSLGRMGIGGMADGGVLNWEFVGGLFQTTKRGERAQNSFVAVAGAKSGNFVLC